MNSFEEKQYFIFLGLFLVALFLGKNMANFVSRVVQYKEGKTGKNYARYSQGKEGQFLRLMLLPLVFTALFFSFQSYILLINLILVFLSVLIVGIDQKIRIIPNELVLAVFLLSILKQLYTANLLGLYQGFLGMMMVGVLFVMASMLAKQFFGQVGVGAGDVKLSLAMGMYFGANEVFNFLISIALMLIITISYGFLFKNYSLKTSFPMGLQIAYGFILAIFVSQAL